MRILIALTNPTKIEDTLQFASQLTRHSLLSPEVMVVTDDKHLLQAKEVLQQASDRLGRAQVNTLLRTGNPRHAILDKVIQGKFELLILNAPYTSNQHNLKLRPDLTLDIVEQSPCSVALVKGNVKEIKRILMCDSGAENPVLSRFVLQLAGLLSGEEEVTVLHVMSQISAGPGVRGQQLRADAEELIQNGTPEGKLLQEDIQILGSPGLLPTAKVRHGLVLDEILDEARQGNYDLVVIGAHHEQGWQRFLLENLAKDILLAVDRPVLVVR
jgi:nucleotide-binding universal stress UspA family protein